MMKRILACLLALACLTVATAALADGDMRVIKVKTAVNMRQKTNTDSTVMAQVPLGTVLTDCKLVEGTEWYAVTYQGISGYIRYDFLEPVSSDGEAAAQAEPATETAPAAEVEPSQAAESAQAAPVSGDSVAALLPEGIDRPISSIAEDSGYADDAVILDTTVGEVRVIARQIFRENDEYIMVVGQDSAGNLLWAQETLTGNVTELTQTDCFIGGTSEKPLVLLYNAWSGLLAYDSATGENVWNVLKEEVELGASITHAVGADGVAYIGGYYGPEPVAIDADGKVLWQANSASATQANWLYAIELRDDGLYAHYGMMAGDKSGWVIYNYDGTARAVAYD